jgi:hypothetical protein
MKLGIFLLFGMMFSFSLRAQEIVVEGRVKGPSGAITGSQVYVVNKSNGRFTIADAFGRFSLKIDRKEEIFISCSGYNRSVLRFSDSTLKQVYQVLVQLSPVEYTLKPVYIPRRPAEDIRKEMQKLGVEKSPAAKLINPIENPISFLYYTFSKRERQKREIQEIENQAKTRQLLKELLRLYVEEGLFYLPDTEFDAYLDFCPLPEEYLKTATDYELIARLKNCYFRFEERR